MIAEYTLRENSIVGNMIERTTSFVRMGVWQGAWDSFLAKPIAGYGIYGLLQGYWYNYTSSLGKNLEWNDNAHSIIFNILGELGIVGILIFFATLFFVIKHIFKKEDEEKGMWFGFFVFTAFYFLFQPYYVDPSLVAVLTIFLLGSGPLVKFSSRHPAYLGLKGLIGVVLLFISYQQYCQINLINQVRVAIVNNENFRKPWDTFMKQTPYVDRAGVMRELNKQMKATLKQKLPRFKRYEQQFPRFMATEYPKVIKSQPTRPRAYENYADWLARNGEHEKALTMIDKILDGADNIPRAYKIKAQIYEEVREYRKAKEMILKAKAINPDYMTLDADLKYLESKIK